MKYIITESQYQNLISEQKINPYIGQKSQKQNFIIRGFTTNNDNRSPLKLYPDNRYEISISLKNISVDKQNILIESVKFSDENRVEDLIFSQEPIGFNQVGKIYFYLVPYNNTKTELFGNLRISINCLVPQKNSRDSLNFNYSYIILPSEKRFEGCKSLYNEYELKIATDWFRKWLNDPITKQKFTKAFNYDTKTVEKHFTNYLEILNQIKLEYTFSNLNNGAWVRPAILQSLGLRTGGYDVPITINCRISSDGSKKEVQETLIHEIQHILSFYHKLHPFRDDIFNFYSNKFEELVLSDVNVPLEKTIEKLKKEGFSDVGAKKVANHYTWMLKNDYEHLTDGTEKLSALYEVRKYLKLVPGQEITKQMLVENYKYNTICWLLSIWLHSGDRLDEFIKEQNTIAFNTNKKTSEVDFV